MTITSRDLQQTVAEDKSFEDNDVFNSYYDIVSQAFFQTDGRFSAQAACVIRNARIQLLALKPLTIHVASEEEIKPLKGTRDWDTQETSKGIQWPSNGTLVLSADFHSLYCMLDDRLYPIDDKLALTEVQKNILKQSVVMSNKAYEVTDANRSVLEYINKHVTAILLPMQPTDLQSVQEKFRLLTQITVGALIAAMKIDDNEYGRQEKFGMELLYPHANLFHLHSKNDFQFIAAIGQEALAGKLPFGFNLLRKEVFPTTCRPFGLGFSERPELQKLFDHFKLVAPILQSITAEEKLNYEKARDKKFEDYVKTMRMFQHPNAQSSLGQIAALAATRVNPPEPAPAASYISTAVNFFKENKVPVALAVLGVAASLSFGFGKDH